MHQPLDALCAGSLVFGGGNVVLPLLQASVVQPDWDFSNEAFLAGYGAAQAVPGALFTFSAYLLSLHGVGAERLDRCGLYWDWVSPEPLLSCRESAGEVFIAVHTARCPNKRGGGRTTPSALEP
ncbi:chromate transporter [Microvirga sp. Mcv34]|uniref:chromate transporter n=1 Tax=Microvirga sp. Mcv34 TaxID=2926016 RepID=UPI003967AF23